MLRPLLFLPLLFIFACNGNDGRAPEMQPYRFDRDALDKLVKEKKAMYNVKKRYDGTLAKEEYYLGDTVKYELQYDRSSRLETVYKRNERGQNVWQENYYKTGQRKARYSLAPASEFDPTITMYHGRYEEYYENGQLREAGEFAKQQLIWKVQFDKERNPGDTLVYEYKD